MWVFFSFFGLQTSSDEAVVATLIANPNVDQYVFLDQSVTDLWQARPGADITAAFNELSLSESDKASNMNCIRRLFHAGSLDPRETPRCEVQPFMLLAFSAILVAVIGIKFLGASALARQLG